MGIPRAEIWTTDPIQRFGPGVEEWNRAWRRGRGVLGLGTAVGHGGGLADPLVCNHRRLVSLVPGSQVVFQRVHVWRQCGHLTENDGKINGYG